MPDISTLQMPEAGELSGMVVKYGPDVLKWSLIALAVGLVLIVVQKLRRKRAALGRIITALALLCGIVSLGAYWILTGQVPDVMHSIEAQVEYIKSYDYSSLTFDDIKGPAVMAGGVLLAVISGFVGRKNRAQRDDTEPSDAQIVVKTIGWLLCVAGALITFGII